MDLVIREQENAATLMVEFKKQISLSKVQTNPYRYVLAWFLKEFSGYDAYKAYFAEKAKEAAAKTDIFTLVQTSATIAGVDEDEEFDFDLASGM